jgi:hypothetical protein
MLLTLITDAIVIWQHIARDDESDYKNYYFAYLIGGGMQLWSLGFVVYIMEKATSIKVWPCVVLNDVLP